MRNILVATDFSEVGNNAVDYIIEAAKEINATVVVYHFFKISGHSANAMISTKDLDTMIAQKKLGFENYVSKLGIIHNISIVSEFKHKDFFDDLNLVIDLYQPIMLAFGMPKNTIEMELFGNITKDAIKKTNFPVLAIPPNVTFEPIQHIIYACDMNKGVNKIILQKINRYAKLFSATVEVLHIGNSLNKLMEKQSIDEALDGVNYYYKDVAASSVMQGILDEAENTQTNVIIMTPHKYGFWTSLLHKSNTLNIISKSPIPILSISI